MALCRESSCCVGDGEAGPLRSLSLSLLWGTRVVHFSRGRLQARCGASLSAWSDMKDSENEEDEQTDTASSSSHHSGGRWRRSRYALSQSLHGGSTVLSMLRGSAAVAPTSNELEHRHSVHGASNFAQHRKSDASIHESKLQELERKSPRTLDDTADPEGAKTSGGRLLWPLNIAGSSSPAARRRRPNSHAKSVHGGSFFAPSHASIWPSGIFSQASPAPRRRGTSSVHGTSLWPHREVARAADDPPPIAAHATFLIHPRTFAIETFEPSDDTERLQQMGRLLHEICMRNTEALENPRAGFRPFDAPGKLPEMSVVDYLLRIRRYCKFSFVCFGVALTYVGRLMGGDRTPGGGAEGECTAAGQCLTFANVHRLLLASISLACKASDDVLHLTSFLALCGGVGASELGALEAEMAEALHWRLMPDVEALERLRQALLDDPIALGSAWSHWMHQSQRPPMSIYHLGSYLSRTAVTAGAPEPLVPLTQC